MATPTDLVNDYMTARISRVPQTPYTQQQSDERYSSEAEDGNNDAYLRKKREYEEEPIPTREEYEANYREAESEYNSQRELDDLDDNLDQSEPDYDDNDNYLEDAKFSGTYFEKPDESEEKSTLGDRIREKYDSIRASASDTAQNLASSFGESFGTAAGVASAKYSRFKRGDPIFSVQSPVRRGKSPSRYISRPGRSISRPYSGGRFGDSAYDLIGFSGQYVPQNQAYYPQDGYNRPQGMDMYLPSGSPQYEGEFGNFNARNEFKNSKYANTKEDAYDPFGYGGLSGDGFNNTGSFGSSLMSFGGDDGILGGMTAGTDTVFGDGAMFNANRTKGKKEVSGFGLDMIIGDSGGMFNISDTLPRKTTTKRKSASKTAKKSSKKTATKRKSARKATIRGFTLP